MSTVKDHAHFEQALSSHLNAITDPDTRNGVLDLLAFTKEEEKKKLSKADKTKQKPRPSGNTLTTLVNAIDMNHIEQTAGTAAKDLVAELIQYAQSLVAYNAATN